MEIVKTAESKKPEGNNPSNLISKIYLNNTLKEYISEWNVEYLPAEKKISKPVMFET